jgi:sialic acid synthase SpsE
MKKITINSKTISSNSPTYIIAEIGSNHNNDYNIALEMIDKAKSAGVDAIKFQSFKAETHYSRYTPGHSNYKKKLYDLIKDLEMNHNWMRKIKNYCDELDIDVFSSPCDYKSVDEMIELRTGALKVASFDLTDVKLIEYMAKSDLAILLSTGMATMGDIENAVNACKKSTNNFALLQCTSLYPAPPRLSNLNAIKTMQLAFDCLVGYSDHTLGDHIAISAVSMGAKIIEKHYTLDREMGGPDHSFAIEPSELKIMVQRIRDVEDSFGDGLKNGARVEETENHSLRRSLIASSDIKKGETLTENNVTIKRPGYGISPIDYDIVIGRVATTNIKEDEWITWNMI